jgi:ABC-type multidrug transport system ATPase subunit
MMATMTVREAIMMSAVLRLPACISMEQKEKYVDDFIKLMNLEKCQQTIIGNSETKGISGGERKRCAMSMEFITNPYILFLDEPT